MAKARRLVADALRLRYADSLLQTQSARIVLLVDEKQSLTLSYTKLLKIAEEKYQIQKETTAHMESLANSWRDQSTYYQKKYRKQRTKTKLSAALILILTGAVILK